MIGMILDASLIRAKKISAAGVVPEGIPNGESLILAVLAAYAFVMKVISSEAFV